MDAVNNYYEKLSHADIINLKPNSARRKLYNIIDERSFIETNSELISKNILYFSDYDRKLMIAKLNSNENEAVITGYAKIGNHPCMIIIFEPKFMMGTMGTVVGEKITRTFEDATEAMLPVISITSSGGARMQEGVMSLMQMVKTVGSLNQHSKRGLLYISVISDPTLGGVTASFASLGDIIIAEENARFGFTGKRIVEETTREILPDDFQSAQYAKVHGQVDLITKEEHLKKILQKILYLHS